MGFFGMSVSARCDGKRDQVQVAAAVDVAAFVTPVRQGWITVHPHEPLDVDALAERLSQKLDVPAVSFVSNDSDAAFATLYTAGSQIARLAYGDNALVHEFVAESPATPVRAVDGATALAGDVDVWRRALGAEAAAVMDDVDGETPFAELVLIGLLSSLGMDGERLNEVSLLDISMMALGAPTLDPPPADFDRWILSGAADLS